MISTNMAARGLDTMLVEHVIQFDFAKTAVDYLHRVGRTGRMGQRGGLVTNLIRKSDYELEQRIRHNEGLGVPLDKLFSRKRSFRKNIKRSSSEGSGAGTSDDE
jgi:superfamily II DNA/RNA helicase